MNTSHFNRLGSVYGRQRPQPFENLDLPYDQYGFDDNFGLENFEHVNTPEHSGDEGEDNNDETLFSLDKLVDVIHNNPELTEFYLLGAEIIQSSNEENNNDIYYSPLYPGTDITVLDLIIVLKLIKSTIKLGDVNESIILGLLASFLPANNAIKVFLSQTSSSIYSFQKLINKSSDVFHKSSIHKIPICTFCFKTPFCGPNRLLPRCLKCRTLKNLKSPNQKYIYYLPLKERLFQLLVSDLKIFFFIQILETMVVRITFKTRMMVATGNLSTI